MGWIKNGGGVTATTTAPDYDAAEGELCVDTSTGTLYVSLGDGEWATVTADTSFNVFSLLYLGRLYTTEETGTEGMVAYGNNTTIPALTTTVIDGETETVNQIAKVGSVGIVLFESGNLYSTTDGTSYTLITNDCELITDGNTDLVIYQTSTNAYIFDGETSTEIIGGDISDDALLYKTDTYGYVLLTTQAGQLRYSQDSVDWFLSSYTIGSLDMIAVQDNTIVTLDIVNGTNKVIYYISTTGANGAFTQLGTSTITLTIPASNGMEIDNDGIVWSLLLDDDSGDVYLEKYQDNSWTDESSNMPSMDIYTGLHKDANGNIYIHGADGTISNTLVSQLQEDGSWSTPETVLTATSTAIVNFAG